MKRVCGKVGANIVRASFFEIKANTKRRNYEIQLIAALFFYFSADTISTLSSIHSRIFSRNASKCGMP